MTESDSRTEHWQRVYATRSPTEVSWYAEHLADSLTLIRSVATARARVIDVGAGASTLLDDLLDAGYSSLTALDISPAALELSKRRLGERAALVRWIVADVVSVSLAPSAFDLWHDRAVLHFLTSDADRGAYIAQAERSVAPGGHAIVATFSPEGPPRCSGLEVARYDARGLANAFGHGFELVRSVESTHRTPAGGEQRFVHCVLRRRPDASRSLGGR